MDQIDSNSYIPDISNSLPLLNLETEKRDPVPFWSENPNILLQSNVVFEFFPVESMSYNQKLNAISRTIIILSLISFLFTQSIRILFIGAITLFVIYLLHYNYQLEKNKSNRGSLNNMENFANPALEVIKKHRIVSNTFDEPQSSNPFSNVLLPDYEYNPQKKPAPPSFNQNTSNDILRQAKQLVIDSNPGQPDIADKLFKDLGEQFVFEQSLQPFYSNAATTIPNDQAGFADFCYGSMISCKEGNLFACARNLDRYTN